MILVIGSAGCTPARQVLPHEKKEVNPADTQPAPAPVTDAPHAPADKTPTAAPPDPRPVTPPTKPPVIAAPAKPDAKPAAPTTTRPAEPAAPATPASPPLDLAGLEKRIKETKAIGVFTKLTLKNQVDDLLSQFRAYYQGRLNANLDQLREPFNSLMLKVLALLQDGDPQLARDLVASREAIWGILADPKKFATL